MTESAQAPAVAGAKKKNPTLGELGCSLPLGVELGGRLHRDIEVRTWRMKEEREVGAAHAAAKDPNVASYVSLTLAMMCKRLGPHDFDKMDMKERLAAISQMFMGDVFYAYMWLRIQSVGSDLKLKIKVPGRSDDVMYQADLNSTEVVTAETFDAACHQYNLKSPIVIRGKPVQTLTLGPLRWTAIEHDKTLGDGNKGNAKAKVIQAAVCGADTYPGTQLVLTLQELDELSKRDLEAITAQIDDHSIGPVMRIEDEYEGKPFKVAIDWRYDSFFAASSE